jgi:hypothetical protein
MVVTFGCNLSSSVPAIDPALLTVMAQQAELHSLNGPPGDPIDEELQIV